MKKSIKIMWVLFMLLLPSIAFAASPAGEGDASGRVVFALSMIIIFAALGRSIATRFHQAPVLGELLIGVLLGNVLFALNHPLGVLVMHLQDVHDDALAGALLLFSNLGILFLLFVVGLENSISEIAKVGVRALMVATVGMIAPFGLGYAAGVVCLPQASTIQHLFIAATLCATSVGITARVFKDLGKASSLESRLILGAAVIDDILGLLVLGVVAGIAASGSFDGAQAVKLLFSSVVFLLVVGLFGSYVVARLVPWFKKIAGDEVKLLFPLAVLFLLSWGAERIGLAGIIGAFAAGVILSDAHFDQEPHENRSLHDLMRPFEALFAPVFFVLMGMQVNLSVFLHIDTLFLGGALVVAGVVGKILSGIVAGKGVSKLSVGIGMIPRGEVGLIFASIGKSLGAIPDSLYSAIVLMVIVTTLITPVALKYSLMRQR